MVKKIAYSRNSAIVIIVILTVLAVLVGMKVTSAQSSVIPESLAVDRALVYTQDDGQFGGALVKPAEIRGQVMTYGQAVQFIYGRPISSGDVVTKIRDYPVWLVILEGEFVEHVPASADGKIPSKEILHTQMAIILDGNTGEVMEEVMISPQKKLSVSTLRLLKESS